MLLREKAFKGDARALERLLALASRFNNEPATEAPQALSADDQAILAAYAAEITSTKSAPIKSPRIARVPFCSGPDESSPK